MDSMEDQYRIQEQIRQETRRRGRDNTESMNTSHHGESSPLSSGNENCFYASFKIYLNPDSRKSSAEMGDEEQVLAGDFTGPGEVVRIEKTGETLDAEVSDEDDKTLSNTNENMLEKSMDDKMLDTDNEEDDEISNL